MTMEGEGRGFDLPELTATPCFTRMARSIRRYRPVPMTLLTTSRLRLEPFTEGHVAGLNAMNSDPEVMRYLSAGRPETLDETRAVVERVMKRWEAVGYSWWAFIA